MPHTDTSASLPEGPYPQTVRIFQPKLFDLPGDTERGIALSQVQIYKSLSKARKSENIEIAVNGQTVFVERLSVEKGDQYIKFSGREALPYHSARFAFDGQEKVRVMFRRVF